MPRMIITHIGTSVLSDQGILKDYKGLNGLRNTFQNNRRPSDAEFNRCVEEASKALKHIWEGSATPQGRREQSPAEIASMSLLKKEQPSDPVIKPDDRVVLLHSDTPDGRFCAELIAAALKGTSTSPTTDYPLCAEQQIAVVQVDGLRVTADGALGSSTQGTAEAFVRQGLVSYVERVWEQYQQLVQIGGGELILNITAGYKGMIPIARDQSMLLTSHASERGYQITSELCYLYEDSNALIRIPALPLRFDWSQIPAGSLALIDDDQGIEVERIPATDRDEHSAYFVIDRRTNRIRRSVLGEVVWAMGKYVNEPLKLDGTQVRRFRDALVDAFPRLSELQQMARHELNENLEDIVNTQNNLRDICFRLITWSQAKGRTRELLRGARKDNSGNPLLEQFAKQFHE